MESLLCLGEIESLSGWFVAKDPSTAGHSVEQLSNSCKKAAPLSLGWASEGHGGLSDSLSLASAT